MPASLQDLGGVTKKITQENTPIEIKKIKRRIRLTIAMIIIYQSLLVLLTFYLKMSLRVVILAANLFASGIV